MSRSWFLGIPSEFHVERLTAESRVRRSRGLCMHMEDRFRSSRTTCGKWFQNRMTDRPRLVTCRICLKSIGKAVRTQHGTSERSTAGGG